MPLMSEVKKTGKRGGKVGTFLSWTLAVLGMPVGGMVLCHRAVVLVRWRTFRLWLAERAVFGGRFRNMFFDCRRAGQIRTWPSRASAIFRTSV